MRRDTRYRLAIDLGSTSLGWCVLRLDDDGQPKAIVRAGVRIFPDGRNPKDGSSLAVTRRQARAMRRRRDRLLKRKARIARLLVTHGFFPQDPGERKKLEALNPYALRAKGLDEVLAPGEFARALFHLSQRRGFRSNRRTDKKDNDSGALKAAIRRLRESLVDSGCRTVGEWLNKRHQDGQTVRARLRQIKVPRQDGKTRIDKSYDLYIDRAMIEAEFDALWQAQAARNPTLFNETARAELKDALLFQRRLRPVQPGRCTLIPEEERAPLALPSTQRFRIYQEVNNLRVLGDSLTERPLALKERDAIVDALERHPKRTFAQIRKLLGLRGDEQFNLEDAKREELKGNITTAILSRKDLFGPAWFSFDDHTQDRIVLRLLEEENEAALVDWLKEHAGVGMDAAERIANALLPEGYGALSRTALGRILPALRAEVTTYDRAVLAAGFDHHSHIGAAAVGEVLPALPYYGAALQRHVGFGSGRPEDTEEKRYGRIANPTVHIALNQVRRVVNALLRRYGHPAEIVVEVARELKQSKSLRDEEMKRQAERQRRNIRLRSQIAEALGIAEDRVKTADLQKAILWEELGTDPADRRCPYTGAQISFQRLLSDEVEVDHILPFSRTLDDSLNNKTVALRQANRLKGNRTPWEAFGVQAVDGFDYAAILLRVSGARGMAQGKRYRFGQDGYEAWLKNDSSFLARALNDTRYMSRVAREYLSLVCPEATRVIPGQLTAMLRAKFGLNGILGSSGEKNRNDHRHHAVDACVIGVTDQRLLQRFAEASARAHAGHLDRLVDEMPLPWTTYRDHVKRAVENVFVSYKPDHSHEGAMHNDTAYGLLGDGKIRFHKWIDGERRRVEDTLHVIPFSSTKANGRHGYLNDGLPRPYKGYKGDSNHCIEIVVGARGKWEGEVVSTFDAYQVVRRHPDGAVLRNPHTSLRGTPLVMRLMIGDYVRAQFQGAERLLVVKKIKSNGAIFVAQHNEANVRQREDAKDSSLIYGSFSASSLQKAGGRLVTVTPVGEVRAPRRSR